MRVGAENRFSFGGSRKKLAVPLAVVIFGMMICGEVSANEVTDVDLWVRFASDSNPQNEITICRCKYWAKMEWSAGTGDEELENNPFYIEIWETGEPTGPEDNDYYPPSGGRIAHYLAGSTVREWQFEITSAFALTVGTHHIRAWAHRDDTVSPNKWEWSSSCTVHVVNVDWIQYDDPDTGWTNIDAGLPAWPLYVRKGTTVTFKAVPEPSDAPWPSGKPVWGGTSGASGTGSTTQVTFDTLSTSLTNYKTVSAECDNTVTIYVIVFDLEGVLTPADNFSGRHTEYYGIEEEVALDFRTDPWSVPANLAGGLEWTRLGGVGTLSNAGEDGTADYDAGATNGSVGLRITIKSGPSKGEFESYGKIIVKPSGTRMTRVNPSNVYHIQGEASAGIKLYYWLDPKNVSFKYLTFGEGSCPSSNVWGFYSQCHPWNSYPSGSQVSGHTQNTFGTILGGHITTGCRVQLPDYAFTGSANPYAAGSFTWSIPTQYIDDTSSRNTFGSNQNHVSTYQANGDAAQAKGGQSGPAALDDPNSSY